MALKQELSVASLVKLSSFLFWCGLYLWYSVSTPGQSPEWCSRVVTLLHGSVTTIVGLSQCGVYGITPWRLTILAVNNNMVKLSSFLFWCGLYLWCSVSTPGQSSEWCSRVVTLLHGSVTTIVGLSQCGVHGITPWRLTMKVSARHYALMLWSWGYFAFDLLWCLVYWTENTLMLCHHLSALVAITIYMGKEYTGCTFACTVALMEITNPLLQTRWFLKNEGYEKTLIFLMVEVTYLLMFVSLRGVLGTYLMYKILQSDLFDMDEKLISLALYLVSLAFVYDVLCFASYKYRDKISKLRSPWDKQDIVDRWSKPKKEAKHKMSFKSRIKTNCPMARLNLFI